MIQKGGFSSEKTLAFTLLTILLFSSIAASLWGQARYPEETEEWL